MFWGLDASRQTEISLETNTLALWASACHIWRMPKHLLFADDDPDADATRLGSPYEHADGVGGVTVTISDHPRSFHRSNAGCGSLRRSHRKANFQTLINLNFMVFEGRLGEK